MCILAAGNLYLRGAVAVLNRPSSSSFPQAVALAPSGYVRQPLPHKGARLPGGRLNVLIARSSLRSLPSGSLVRSPSAVLLGSPSSPPGRLRRPAPQGGSLVRAYRPRGSGER